MRERVGKYGRLLLQRKSCDTAHAPENGVRENDLGSMLGFGSRGYYNGVVYGESPTRMPRKVNFKIDPAAGKGLKQFLGELELAIMEAVWDHAPITVAEVVARLEQANRSLAYTTVMTVMSRLTEKGWLSAEKGGRAYAYRPVHSREKAEAAAVGEVVRALLRDFGAVAVAQFVKELDELDRTQLAKLAELAKEDAVAGEEA